MSQEEKLFFDHRFPSQAGANHLPTRFVTSRESYVEKVLEIRKKKREKPESSDKYYREDFKSLQLKYGSMEKSNNTYEKVAKRWKMSMHNATKKINQYLKTQADLQFFLFNAKLNYSECKIYFFFMNHGFLY